MRIFTWLAACALALSVSGAELQFNFGDYDLGSSPTNFRSALGGGGTPGAWKIISAETPSAFTALNGNTPLFHQGKVLAQTGGNDLTDERYPMFVYDRETFRDFKFSTKFKVVSGVAEQMAGVVFRFQNSSNFYVIRISVLGNNIGFYKMVNGQIVSPVKLPLNITAGTWHKLEVECSGIYINCLVDGQKALPVISDQSPPDGKLGFWTKSDSISYFTEGEVTYTPRIPPAQQIIDSVMAKESRLVGLRIYTLSTNNTTRIIASKDKSEVGQPGGDAELLAIQNGTVSYGKEKGVNHVTMPLHDRNGEYIGALRVKSNSFLGETENTALTRATMVRRMVEEYCTTGDELKQ